MVVACWRYVLMCCFLVHTCTAAGRLFVTMLGYPTTCTRGHVSHACTISLACWMAGGSSEPGCGASPWLVACCVTKSKHHQQHEHDQYVKLHVQKHHHQEKQQQFHQEFTSELNALHQGSLEFSIHKTFSITVYNVTAFTVTKKLYYIGWQKCFNSLCTRLKESATLLQRRADEIPVECGLSADRMLYKRIIGGKEARFAQFPWQAHIRIAAYQCGGVLVSQQYVATAAHCIIRARLSEIVVFLGELDTQDTGQVLELAPAEHHHVRRKVVHPLFRFKITQPDRYDLALLQLSIAAGRMFHISPVCLPQPGIRLQGRSGVVAGWGKIKPSTELTGTNVLRSATVPILDSEECVQWHGTRQINVDLHEDMVCAGHADGSQDACLGDSGGPLIVLERGYWTLVGITSAGFGCGEPRQPGIYHNVALTADWIRSTIE